MPADDRVRAAVRVTAEQLAPGDRVTPWGDRDSPRRRVAAAYLVGEDVLIEWADGTVERVHKWTPYHAKNRRPNLHRDQRHIDNPTDNP